MGRAAPPTFEANHVGPPARFSRRVRAQGRNSIETGVVAAGHIEDFDRVSNAAIAPSSRTERMRSGVRVAEGARLESVCAVTYRGFESHPLRHFLVQPLATMKRRCSSPRRSISRVPTPNRVPVDSLQQPTPSTSQPPLLPSEDFEEGVSARRGLARDRRRGRRSR